MLATILLELLKSVLPALVVFLTVYTMLKQHFAHQEKLKAAELNKTYRQDTLPLRLQAYERMTMFLERISLPKLILRIRTESMNSRDLQIALNVALEQEYDHNSTQQMYMSSGLWELIRMAKGEVGSIINTAAKSLPENATGLDLSRAIFSYLENSKGQIAQSAALEGIKEEVRKYLS